MRMKTGRRCKALLAASAGIALLLAGSVALAAPSPAPDNEGLKNEQQLRKERQQEYIRRHSRPSGKVSSQDYIKGMQHVRQMKVAPSIGAQPLGESTASSTPKPKAP